MPDGRPEVAAPVSSPHRHYRLPLTAYSTVRQIRALEELSAFRRR